MIYALALSRATGIDLYHFKCAWFDDRDYFEFYPRTVVQKSSRRTLRAAEGRVPRPAPSP